MPILPEELWLHLARLTAANGEWLVAVHNVTKTQGEDNLLLNLVLEQPVDEENVRSRKLGLIVSGAVIFDPETSPQIIDRIRGWVETTDGDGFLDLVQHGS
jgi:hypothetical protein